MDEQQPDWVAAANAWYVRSRRRILADDTITPDDAGLILAELELARRRRIAAGPTSHHDTYLALANIL